MFIQAHVANKLHCSCKASFLKKTKVGGWAVRLLLVCQVFTGIARPQGCKAAGLLPEAARLQIGVAGLLACRAARLSELELLRCWYN